VSLHSVQIGLAFLHLAVTSQIPQVRRAVIKALEVGVANQPQIVNRIVRESLAGSLVRDKLSTSKTPVTLGEQPEVSLRRQARLLAFLFSAAAIGEDVDRSIRENLMTELIVLGHHPAICRLQVYHPKTAQLIFWGDHHQVEARAKRGSSYVRKLEPIHTILSTRISTSCSRSFWQLQ
jgi:hypothetical protein